MKKPNQSGGIAVVLSDVILIGALIAAIIFGYWAYSGRQDYKNNVDQKIAQAVSVAQTQQQTKDATAAAEAAKSPNKTFHGSPTYGTVTFDYAKTWSAYNDDSNSNEPINAYFHPDVVPSTQSNTAYALRVELTNTSYSDVLQQFDSQIRDTSVTAKAYVPPKMSGASNVQPGTRLDGAITRDNQGHPQQGSMVVIKVRDKTLQIYTESPQFLNDFNNTILASLTFVP